MGVSVEGRECVGVCVEGGECVGVCVEGGRCACEGRECVGMRVEGESVWVYICGCAYSCEYGWMVIVCMHKHVHACVCMCVCMRYCTVGHAYSWRFRGNGVSNYCVYVQDIRPHPYVTRVWEFSRISQLRGDLKYMYACDV